MQTAEEIKRRLQNTRDLQSVVKTMKAMAAAGIRQYIKAVESLRDYSHAIELGFQVVLMHQSGSVEEERPLMPGGNTAAVVFGSDQGMVGQFNQRIAAYTMNVLDRRDISIKDVYIIPVGIRLANLLSEESESRGATVMDSFQVPSSVSAITLDVQSLLVNIESWRHKFNFRRIIVFHNKLKSKSGYRQNYFQIWPVDIDWFRSLQTRGWGTNNIPTFTMEHTTLMASLIKQYLFVALYRAFAESLASENAARLTSMQAAERNIDEKIAELTILFQQERQTNITEELNDIISGYKSLKSKRSEG